jgi:GTP-binding protein
MISSVPKPGADLFRVVQASFEAGAASLGGLPVGDAPEIAFAGRSNVGKSSVMNALLQRNGLVRTSSTPGCTRALNVFSATLIDGQALRLVDLPGYGWAKLAKTERKGWGAMMEDYLRGRATLRAVVLIVDVRRGFEDDDLQLAEFLMTCRGGGELPSVLVATKTDKLSVSKRKPALAALEQRIGERVVGFSGATGDGRDVLWKRLAPLLG